MNKLADAIQVAAYAHSGQKDKAGEEYILHPLRVMLQMETEEERIVAVLHDVLEDTEIDAEKLRDYRFSDRIIYLVGILTKQPKEPLEAYYARVRAVPVALKVKLADIRDNIDASRMNLLDAETRNRLFKKYDKAIAILTAPTTPKDTQDAR